MDEPGLVACGSAEGLIRIISWKTGDAVRNLFGHTKKITSLLAINGRQLLISGPCVDTIRKWPTYPADVSNGGEAIAVLEGHEGEVELVAVSSEEQLISSGSLDKTVQL